MQDTRERLIATSSDFPPLRRRTLRTLQVNLGYRCNLSCVHCHVNAGPSRTEMMSDDMVDLIIEIMRGKGVQTLDLTGGAPEMHPAFRRLVQAARQHGVEVIDRCNLTILLEPGHETTARFLADHQVRVVASLPCYLEQNVDSQRGKGTFAGSIAALQALNALGYARSPALVLDLVYNPLGAHLPPPQAQLEADYKRELKARWDIEFNSLLTITNMPISRFGAVLLAKGQFDDYMALLRDSYNGANLDGVMCRDTVSVDYQGNLYDCDFNQMLALPAGGAARTLRDLLTTDTNGDLVAVASHCYGCTAGAGSSCGGSLS